MKNIKKITFVLVMCLLGVSLLLGQTEPKKTVAACLTQAYVDAFAKNFSSIENELDAMNFDMGENPTAIQSLSVSSGAYAKVNAMLAKYGLGNKEPINVISAISLAYAIVSMETELASPEMAPYVSIYKPIMDDYTEMVHRDDIELIRKNKAKLDKVFN